MKSIVRNSIFIVASALFITNISMAANTSHKMNQNNMMKWNCETNASSSSNPTDQKADDEMTKKAKSAKAAFDFALNHCRDCTKITCTTASNTSNTESTSNTTDNSNTGTSNTNNPSSSN
jgi:hypothetical protein